MAKIISLANQKGGVGKTTSTINFGACLALAGKKTLLVDLDPQGNASVGVGLEKDNFSEANIYHLLIGTKATSEVIYPTEIPLLKIIPAEKNLVGAEIELVGAFSRESKLKMALEKVKDEFDYILIDCPPSLGLLTVNALTCSDTYLVPMQTEYFAMEGLSQLINTVKLIRSQLNPNLELEGILLTMFDVRNNLHKQVMDEIRGHFKDKVFNTLIPRNVKLSECPSFGRPVVLYDVESKGSEAYFMLTKEFLTKSASLTKKKNQLPNKNKTKSSTFEARV